ncbi:unnamed protein product [Darwinula stevensoni]|uniref:Uncharacterized protein n=1 Tax=Darwinula stevensoni TaxID=69355 RepID=A0A7R8XBK4_9CRUS|nr:unnamed protein product [Darwinula stevensoni]CAG0892894.1 unnamed protein product [Darwinula stevensoni]
MENPTFTDDDGVRPRKHDAIGTQVVEGSLSTAIQRALGTHADAAGDSSEKLAGSESQEDGSGSLPPEKDEVHLKRRVGLLSGVALIVGTMIGTFCRRLRANPFKWLQG